MFIPLLILLKNPTMRKFALNWIAVTVFGSMLETSEEILSLLQLKFGKIKAPTNQVSPLKNNEII